MYSTYTTNGDTSNIRIVRVSYRDTQTYTPAATSPTMSYWEPSPRPVYRPPVLTEKMIRDIAAAKQHAQLMAGSVRMRPDKAPERTEKQHRQGHYDGPRFSAHTATRVR